jgi:hypothetical protein
MVVVKKRTQARSLEKKKIVVEMKMGARSLHKKVEKILTRMT